MAYVEICFFNIIINENNIKLTREGTTMKEFEFTRYIEPTQLADMRLIQRGIEHTLQFFRESRGNVMFLGSGREFLLGQNVDLP